jgi:hypothetical protein
LAGTKPKIYLFSATKRRSARKNDVPSSARIDAYIDKMMASVNSNTKERDERIDARWNAMMQRQDMNLELEKEKVG